MTALKERKNKSSVLYEDLKESLEDILSYERGTSNLKFVEDTVTVEDFVSPELIYSQLRERGFDKSYSQKFLFPSWFKKQFLSNESELKKLATYLRENIFTSIKAYSFQYKKNKSLQKQDIQTATEISILAANTIDSVFNKPYKALPQKPKDIIHTLKKKSNVIELDTILDYLWESGIPVLYISQFPKKTKKMTAVSIMIQERPVIILSKSHKYPSWYLFELAHEIGHIALGHLKKEGIILDENLDMSSNDPMEKEADEFALSILEGNDLKSYFPTKLNPSGLYGLAIGLSNKLKINPGFIILSYAKYKDNYAIGNVALRLLGEEFNPSEYFINKIDKYLKVTKANKKKIEFLKKLAGTI